jgi:gamma-glutamylcyclotransferase (GGCT)/AIG2-like uncharacterized protein YtfP
VAFGRRGGRPGKKPGWSTDAHEIIDKVFVYGTLREGQPARSMLESYIEKSQPGTVKGTIFAFPDGYPGLLEDGADTVHGEVIKMSDLSSAFALLDAYEGDDFIRIIKTATVTGGAETPVWIYVLADERMVEGATRIESGDWVEYDGSI